MDAAPTEQLVAAPDCPSSQTTTSSFAGAPPRKQYHSTKPLSQGDTLRPDTRRSCVGPNGQAGTQAPTWPLPG